MRRVLILAVAASLLAFPGCDRTESPASSVFVSGKTGDEAQIASVLDQAARGLETRRVSRVMIHVSRNYRDAEGRDYEAIRQYVARIVKGYRMIRITRMIPKIVVEGERARALETFGTAAEPFDEASDAPINLQGQVEVLLERENNVWRIVEWGSVL